MSRGALRLILIVFGTVVSFAAFFFFDREGGALDGVVAAVAKIREYGADDGDQLESLEKHAKLRQYVLLMCVIALAYPYVLPKKRTIWVQGSLRVDLKAVSLPGDDGQGLRGAWRRWRKLGRRCQVPKAATIHKMEGQLLASMARSFAEVKGEHGPKALEAWEKMGPKRRELAMDSAVRDVLGAIISDFISDDRALLDAIAPEFANLSERCSQGAGLADLLALTSKVGPGANSNKKSMTTEFAAVRMEIIKQGGERNFLGTFRSLCLLSITTRAIEVLSGTAATSASGILWIVSKTGPISLGLAFLLWVIMRALV